MLRPYQQEDVERILQQRKLGVFNEQRTGKTPTVLTALNQVNGRALFICPASMVLKIQEEAKRWMNNYTAFAYTGTPKQREATMCDYLQKDNALLISSYEMFKETKNTKGINIGSLNLNSIIWDEAHRITRKTGNAMSAKATNVQKIHNTLALKLLLTGTPVSNHPSQVWSLLNIIDPRTFTSYWRFVEEFFVIEETRLPVHVQMATGRSHSMSPGDFLPGKSIEFAKLLDKYAINRKRAEVMDWLPEAEAPTRINLPCTPQQTKEANNLISFFKLGDVRVQGILDQLIRLRQLYNSPELVGLKGKSPKIDWLKSYLSDYPEKKVIVFSRFTQFLELIGNELKGQGELYVGNTSLSKRQDLIHEFQNGTLNVLLIQVDAGKEGITLDAADTLIFMDIYPPVSDNDQARDRIIPTVESRLKAYEIIEVCMKDTYDEELYDMYYQRKGLTDIANNFKEYILKEG